MRPCADEQLKVHDCLSEFSFFFFLISLIIHPQLEMQPLAHRCQLVKVDWPVGPGLTKTGVF